MTSVVCARALTSLALCRPPSNFLSVRAKLAVLVALPIVLMGAAVPLLSTMLERELSDAADDHVEDVERSFQAELEDDLADLELAGRIMAQAGKTVPALETGQAKDALTVAEVLD